MYKKSKIRLIFFYLLIFFNASLALGASATQYDHFVDKTGFSTAQNVGSIMSAVIGGFLSLLSIIFIVLILYAGFNWMTAAGDEQKVTKAKDTITKAVIGLVIIVAAYSITYFVFNALPYGSGSSGSVVGGSGSGDTGGDTSVFGSIADWWNSWSFSDLFSGSGDSIDLPVGSEGGIDASIYGDGVGS